MHEVKIEKLNDLFTFVKIEPLLKTYTDINPNGGIRMRLNGKGTNAQGRKELKPEEKEGLESALKQFFTEGLEFLNNIQDVKTGITEEYLVDFKFNGALCSLEFKSKTSREGIEFDALNEIKNQKGIGNVEILLIEPYV